MGCAEGPAGAWSGPWGHGARARYWLGPGNTNPRVYRVGEGSTQPVYPSPVPTHAAPPLVHPPRRTRYPCTSTVSTRGLASTKEILGVDNA